MWRTHYALEIQPAHHTTVQRLAGWVESIRNMEKIAFLIVRDRSGTFQVVLPKAKVDAALFERAVKMNRESVVSIEGTINPSKQARNGWELLPTKLDVLNEAAAPLPLGVVDKVNVEIDTRLDHRFMDIRRPGPQAIFKIRSAVLGAGHEYLRKQGFLEIHTSRIIGASSEGGTEVFKVKYFENEAFLSQSPQLYKQAMMATGFDRVYEVATYFRAEKHNTPRHLNEITAFDLEMAWIQNEEEVMETIQGLFHHIWSRVASEHAKEIETVAQEYHGGSFAGVPVPKLPFLRVPFTKAVEMLQAEGVELPTDDPAAARGGDLAAYQINPPEEKALAKIVARDGHDFFYITKFPLAQKPFYCMPEGETMDAKLSRSFDLEYRGVELLSGAQRIHQPGLLVQGLERVGLDPKAFERYLEAFRYGMPPHGGCGIGVERILMQMLELPNIREGVLFPRDRSRLTP